MYNQISNKIEHDLKIIVSEILNYFQEEKVEAIALIGGLGRGEATRFRYISQNEETQVLLSDYDILVLVTDFTQTGRCLSLRKKLSKRIGNEVEIAAKPKKAISQLPVTQSTYDMSKHRILWGKQEEIRNVLPIIDPSQLSINEGDKLFFNRGAGLIGAASLFRGEKDIKFDETAFFMISQCVKAIIAVGDAFLIFHHKYTISCAEKYEVLSNLDVPIDLIEQYKWAAQFRINSEPPLLREVDLVEMWQTVTKLFQKWHQQLIMLSTNNTFVSWDNYSTTHLKLGIHKPKTYIKIFLQNIKIFGKPCSLNFWSIWSYLLPIETRLWAVTPSLINSLVKPDVRPSNLIESVLNMKITTIENEIGLREIINRYYELWSNYIG